MFSPAVLTSRSAKKDYEKIMGTHSSLLKGMALQAQKVEMFNQQKAAEMQAQQTMKAEMDKEKMVADTAAQKNATDFALKQADLDLKRAALSAT